MSERATDSKLKSIGQTMGEKEEEEEEEEGGKEETGRAKKSKCLLYLHSLCTATASYVVVWNNVRLGTFVGNSDLSQKSKSERARAALFSFSLFPSSSF